MNYEIRNCDIPKEIYEIKQGTTLYRKELNKYKEVRVYDIYFEKYINGWKTIIKVITDSQIIYTHFVSDLNYKLFTEIPKEELEGKSDD